MEISRQSGTSQIGQVGQSGHGDGQASLHPGWFAGGLQVQLWMPVPSLQVPLRAGIGAHASEVLSASSQRQHCVS